MDKEEFNKLSIEEQIKNFNTMYIDLKSIRKVAAELKISKNTLSERYRNAGYNIIEGIGYVRSTNTLPLQETALTSVPSADKIDIAELKQLVNRMINEKFSNKITDIELSPKCEGEVKYRSLGAFKNVLEDFINYCKKKKRYSQIELLSQAMIEFQENHP